MENAAQNLEGLTLQSGWNVTEKLSKPIGTSGSFFSVCYRVERNSEISFLKAFDFARFFKVSEQGKDMIDIMGDMIEAYKYERDLSNHCKANRVTKVAFVRDAGQESIPGYSISIVPYLVFDLADGDVRSRLEFSESLDFAWKLNSLHDVAVGLMQLHKISVSHQDLKPSNVLVFRTDSKIGDIGRSICRDIESPYDGMSYSGDFNYAPPEIMYGFYNPDWNSRVFATDCYHLGSMIVFYFAGISMSALLLKHLPEKFRWENWRGSFEEIRPYLVESFTLSLREFEGHVKDKYFQTELTALVEQLCFPFPNKRGHPKNFNSVDSQYSLIRYVSKLDYLTQRAKYQLIN